MNLGERFEIDGDPRPGGFGTVFDGVDREDGQPCRIHLLKAAPTSLRCQALAHRFRRLEGLNGPCLRWLGHGTVLQRSLYAVEARRGEPCAGPLDAPDLRRAALDLLDALRRLHARSQWHGAPVPELVARDGQRFFLGGLFLGGEAAAGRLAGLVAPEWSLRCGPNSASDVYILGLTLHALATGRLPTEVDGAGELERRLGLGDLLERDPDRRPAAAEAWARLRGNRLPARDAGDEESAALELARRIEKGGTEGIAVEGEGGGFLLEAAALELASVRPVLVSPAADADAPMGLALAILHAFGQSPVPDGDEPLRREDLELLLRQALETRRRDGALALLIPDLDRADGPSRRLIRELCGRIGVLLAGAFREGPVPPGFEVMTVDERWRWRKRLPALSAGTEERLPEAIGRELSRLPPEGRAVLEAASVAPPRRLLEELQELAASAELIPRPVEMERLARAADELVVAGWLSREVSTDGAERLSPLHPLVADTVRERMAPDRRGRLSQRVGGLLELGFLDGAERWFLLHRHLAESGSVRPALLERLVRHSAELGDVERSRRLLRDNEEAFRRLPDTVRLELLAAADEMEQATQVAQELLLKPDREDEGRIRAFLGRFLRRQTRFEEARREQLRAWTLRRHLTLRQRVELALELARSHSQLARVHEAEEWLRRASSLQAEEKDPVLRSRYLSTRGDVLWRLSQPAAAMRCFLEARKLLPRGHREGLILLPRLGSLQVVQGELEAALQTHRAELALAIRSGRPSSEAQARFNVARVLFFLERDDEARREAKALLSRPLLPNYEARVLELLGCLEGREGRLRPAQERFARAREKLGAGQRSLRRELALEEALLLLDHGELAAARSLLQETEPPVSGPSRADYLAVSAFLEAREGRIAAAERQLEELEPTDHPVACEAWCEIYLHRDEPLAAARVLERGHGAGPVRASSYRRGRLELRRAEAFLRAGLAARAAECLRTGQGLLESAPEMAQGLMAGLAPRIEAAGAAEANRCLESLQEVSGLLEGGDESSATTDRLVGAFAGVLGPGGFGLAVRHPKSGRIEVVSGYAPESGQSEVPALPEGLGANVTRLAGEKGWCCGLVAGRGVLGVVWGRRASPAGVVRLFVETCCRLGAVVLERCWQARSAAEPVTRRPEGYLIGEAPVMVELMREARSMASSGSHLLILGESGTGKTELARWIHESSARRQGTFYPVDLAAEPADLVSAHLFGYEKGAFTGADRASEGHIAAAEGGTLFLDEIGDIGPNVQQKLLMFLQSKRYRRLGSTVERTADVRVLLATNKDLKQEIADGRFREDLYFRIAPLELTVPPLRARREDILLYARHFLEAFCRQEGREVLGFEPEAEVYLRRHRWPGNLRDLRNSIHRAVVLCAENGWIGVEHLRSTEPAYAEADARNARATLREARAELDRRFISSALEAENGNRTQAARRLGVTRQGLLGMMRRYALT